MSSVGTSAEATIRWVAESMALSHGTDRNGSRWRLRFDGALWRIEQLDGTWQSRGTSVGYRAAVTLAGHLAQARLTI